MPCYKDDQRGSWYCKFSYQDYTGARRQKLKRGFSTKRDATAWERTFLERYQKNPDLSFGVLCTLYLENQQKRRKRSTYDTAKSMCSKWLLPYWKDRIISEITAADVQNWQNDILAAGLSEAYQYNLNRQFSMVMNFGVRYHGLVANPCSVTPPIGKANVRRLEFWTKDQFNAFLETVESSPLRVAFLVLFYTGMRLGELLALTLDDFDAAGQTIRIGKTYHRYDKEDCCTTPKTERSTRKVTLPSFLVDALKEYVSQIYGIEPTDRIFFHVTARKLKTAIQNGAKQAGLEPITIHSFRHSHVSLLIELGFSTFLIAERIGDSPEMVNRVYGHLYPNRHKEVAEQLHNLVSK